MKTFTRHTLALALLASAAAATESLKPVDLNSAEKFAVLAGSLVSDIPTADIRGDIGLSPAAGSNITGFGPTEVTGTIYTVDATGPAGSVPAASDLTTAKGDLTIAYNDAAGRTPVPTGPFLNPGAGNIGGLTLVPGLYKFTSTLEISGSDVTLTGEANDVWIFQVAANFNVANDIKVILAGSAKASNIFWQIGTSATLGTNCVVHGTIMADQSISLNTGAVLHGRALASIAAVTLASGTIIRPALVGTGLKARTQQGFTLVRVQGDAARSALTLEFAVPSRGRAVVTIMNASGRKIATLFDGVAEAGKRTQVRFNTGGMPAGVCYAKLEFNGKARLTKQLPVN